jgi:hypothetical protein
MRRTSEWNKARPEKEPGKPGQHWAGVTELAGYKAPDLPHGYPEVPGVIEARCKICQIYRTNRELFHWVNAKLMDGSPPSEIHARLLDEGIEVRGQTLSRHKSWHLLPFLMKSMELHHQIMVWTSTISDDVQDQNLAVLLARMLATACLIAVGPLDPAEIQKLPVEKRVKLALAAAETLGKVQAGDAATRLAIENLKLKAIQLKEKDRALFNVAMDAFRSELQSRPELLAKIEPILQQLAEGAGPSEVEHEPDG